MPNSRLIKTINLAIVFVAVLLAIVIVRKYFLTTAPQALPSIAVGTEISIPDVDWTATPRTLLIVLRNDCRFCTESAPFYRQLVAKSSGFQNLRLIAVSPHSTNITRQYLDSLGVSINEIRESQLHAISVAATPTLILVDDRGKVKDSWVGFLDSNEEAVVFDSIASGL